MALALNNRKSWYDIDPQKKQIKEKQTTNFNETSMANINVGSNYFLWLVLSIAQSAGAVEYIDCTSAVG